MKCEVYQELLEEYFDAELAPVDRERVGAHLITCAACSAGFAALSAEQEIFSRYDREHEVPPFLWTRILQETVAENTSNQLDWRKRFAAILRKPSWAGALAILLMAVTVGAVYLISDDPPQKEFAQKGEPAPAGRVTNNAQKVMTTTLEDPKPKFVAKNPGSKRKVRPTVRARRIDQSGVLSTELSLDLDDRDTARHLEQTQNLLRSIRNVLVADGDEEIDVTYDKALSRRLLNENIVLRREAEMKAKFPTKTLLADVEPFLIDIANLPDHAPPEDVQVIKERVQKTEIVAALMSYQYRGPNNR